MRTSSRDEPVNERRQVVFNTDIIESARAHEDKVPGKYFERSEIHERKKQLNELSELRSHFVAVSRDKCNTSHRPLKTLSTSGKIHERESTLKEFLLGLFSR